MSEMVHSREFLKVGTEKDPIFPSSQDSLVGAGQTGRPDMGNRRSEKPNISFDFEFWPFRRGKSDRSRRNFAAKFFGLSPVFMSSFVPIGSSVRILALAILFALELIVRFCPSRHRISVTSGDNFLRFQPFRSARRTLQFC